MRIARCGLVASALVACGVFLQAMGAPPQKQIENDRIDAVEHLRMVEESSDHRSTRRLTEGEFIELASRPGVRILDARSEKRFSELHIRSALNIPFPDITVESLAEAFPDKNATILIYCNNNFLPNTPAFPSKSAPAALNLNTYATLYTYGYRNIYELGPVLDVNTTKLDLVGTLKPDRNSKE